MPHVSSRWIFHGRWQAPKCRVLVDLTRKRYFGVIAELTPCNHSQKSKIAILSVWQRHVENELNFSRFQLTLVEIGFANQYGQKVCCELTRTLC